MADTHVISALVKKRAELRGDIIHYKQLIATLDKDLQTIDATIKIFDVDYDISSIKPVIKSRNRFFNKTDKSNFQKSILLALNTCLSNSIVEKVSKDGLSIVWKIKELN